LVSRRPHRTVLPTIADDATVSSDDATVSSDDDFAETREPPFTGSIQGPVEDDSLSEADETAQLESLATISADEATAAAISAVPGEIGEVELENEHGSVVYSVEITDAAGARTKVIVDAGNAEILSQLTKDGNGKGDHQDDEVEGADDGTENEARHDGGTENEVRHGAEANEDSEPGDA